MNTLVSGSARLCTVLALLVSGAVVYSLNVESIASLLRWLDMLAPKPGLSGLALLALSPVLFLAALFVLQWVLDGYKRAERRP